MVLTPLYFSGTPRIDHASCYRLPSDTSIFGTDGPLFRHLVGCNMEGKEDLGRPSLAGVAGVPRVIRAWATALLYSRTDIRCLSSLGVNNSPIKDSKKDPVPPLFGLPT